MLREGESWGAWGKTAYQTANKQFLETGAVYGRSNLGTGMIFDGLASLTWRKGDNMRIGGGETYNYSSSELTSFSGKLSGEYGGHKVRASVLYGESANWGPLAAIRGQLQPSSNSLVPGTPAYKEAMRRLLAWRELKDFTSVFEHTYDGDSDRSLRVQVRAVQHSFQRSLRWLERMVSTLLRVWYGFWCCQPSFCVMA